jgi:UDP-glucose 4-epimerase
MASRRSFISQARFRCRNRIADPLGYYQNNTANSLALIRTAVATGVKQLRLFLNSRGLRDAAER